MFVYLTSGTYIKLPFGAKYTIFRETNTCEIIQEHLEWTDFCDPISINESFPENRQLHYTFINDTRQGLKGLYVLFGKKIKLQNIIQQEIKLSIIL